MPIKEELNERKNLYSQLSNSYSKLESFQSNKENMLKIKNQIDNLVYSLPLVEYNKNKDLVLSYRDRVLKVAKKYSINILSENYSGEENSGTRTLSLTFKTDYNTMCMFLFDVEMFSKVKSFSFDIDENATLVSEPLCFGVSVDDYFNGRRERMGEIERYTYFENIFSKANQTLKSIDFVPNWRCMDPLPKDPFIDNTPKPVVVVRAKIKKKKVIRKPPAIHITGILYDEVNPVVIIEGIMYKIGDYYTKNSIPMRIIAIKERSITLELDGLKHIIKFKRED